MKKQLVLVFLIIILCAFTVSSQSLKGMSLNGATGLISIPSARIGWEKSAEVGIDVGYHAIFDDPDNTSIPKASVSLFKIAEIAFAYDTQGDSDDSDMLFNVKVKLPLKSSSAVALGMNYQALKMADNKESVNQIYIATTYPGDFFKMPAETTLTIGKTFGDIARDDDIDFGMGFDLLLFPSTFNGLIHWINDFANFSYSYNALGSNSVYRGSFNTGIRIDLSTIPALNNYKCVIDVLMTDAFDENRAFSLGGSFGLAVKK